MFFQTFWGSQIFMGHIDSRKFIQTKYRAHAVLTVVFKQHYLELPWCSMWLLFLDKASAANTRVHAALVLL